MALAWLAGLLPAQAEELRARVDRHVAAAWQKEQVSPAGPADDAAFLRRIYLDLCGTIPTAQEAATFLDDPAPDKRAKLIDRLLEDPRYARQQADQWDLLYFGRNPPGSEATKRRGFQKWLRNQFAANTPYDQIARSILEARGNTVDDGAAMFFVQYRKQPEEATVKITQTFLGVQLQCAQCHDHPYEPWKQLDFFGMAAFLARLEVVELGGKDDNKKLAIGEKNAGEVNFVGPASQAAPGKKGEPVAPKFLLGGPLEEPATPKGAKEEKFESGKEPPAPAFSRKDALAAWIVARENPYFAKATVNRIWAQFLGKGLIHPVDNLSAANPPSHPELLAEMTEEFVAKKYDVRWLIRELVNSQTYQLASTGEVAAERPLWFERARVRPLSAEELVEGWRIATNFEASDSKATEQLEKDRLYPLGEYQKRFFGEPTDGVGNFLGGMHEHLYLNNGGIDRLFGLQKEGLLYAISQSAEGKGEPREAIVERMYLAVLTRRPTAAESQKFVEYLSKDRGGERAKSALWALMTSSEYRFNH